MGSIIFALTAVLIIVFDQLSKLWINTNLSLGQTIWQYSFIRIVLVYNNGAAFGLFQGNILPLIVIRIIGVLVILGLIIFLNKKIQLWGGTWIMVALGLVLGGTIGNLIDSIRLGYVVDFVDFTYWPVFNIADSSVVVAAFILGIMLLKTAITDNKKPKST